MEFFITVLGRVLFVEGLPYFAFPDRMKVWMERVIEMPDAVLRTLGFVMMSIGMAVIYLVRRG
nr:DUF2065 domain-containing protein [Desulfobacterales bacterium]